MAGRTAPLALALASALLAVGGLAVAAIEARPFLQFGIPATDRVTAITTLAPSSAVSVFAGRVVLDECLASMNSPLGRTQPAARREALHRACVDHAEAALALRPSHSYAHLVLAVARFGLGETEAANAALVRSQATGPVEQWIAELRALVAEERYALLSDAARAAQRADLVLLAQSWRGVGAIADRYINYPDFRERITAVVETLPEPIQRSFLDAVRNAAWIARGGR